MYETGCVLKRIIRVGSWLTLGCAFLLLGTAFFASWAVNDAAFGRYDLGLAISMASVAAVAAVIGLYSAPVLGISSALVVAIDRWAAVRQLAAAIVCALPFVLVV